MPFDEMLLNYMGESNRIFGYRDNLINSLIFRSNMLMLKRKGDPGYGDGGAGSCNLENSDWWNTERNVSALGVVELESVQPLAESYIRLRYRVIS